MITRMVNTSRVRQSTAHSQRPVHCILSLSIVSSPTIIFIIFTMTTWKFFDLLILQLLLCFNIKFSAIFESTLNNFVFLCFFFPKFLFCIVSSRSVYIVDFLFPFPCVYPVSVQHEIMYYSFNLKYFWARRGFCGIFICLTISNKSQHTPKRPFDWIFLVVPFVWTQHSSFYLSECVGCAFRICLLFSTMEFECSLKINNWTTRIDLSSSKFKLSESRKWWGFFGLAGQTDKMAENHDKKMIRG